MAFDIHDFVEQGIAAEEAGFESVWMSDHFTDLPPSNDKYDPWTILATIGARTKEILLGTLAEDCTRRHPASTAHLAATLDNLTSGRVILGIGAGEAMNILPFGLPWESAEKRVERLKEHIECIRLLWKSTVDSPANFRGEFYQLNNARLDLHPYDERILPIYVASLGARRALELTGTLGNGWLPWFNTIEDFVRRCKIIDRTAEANGRSVADIEKTAVVYMALTDDPAKQRTVLDSMKSEIIVLNSPTRLAKLGYVLDPVTPLDYSYQRTVASTADAQRALRLGAGLPDNIANRFLIAGNSETCVARLEEFSKAGARHLIIRNMLWANKLEDFKDTLRRVGREIIPAFG